MVERERERVVEREREREREREGEIRPTTALTILCPLAPHKTGVILPDSISETAKHYNPMDFVHDHDCNISL